MRTLFDIDTRDYKEDGTRRTRPSVRTIIIQDGKVAMLHVLRFNYYKFPGGGIEPGETHEQTAIRETLEEAGLVVKPGSVRPYGNYHMLRRDTRWADIFDQDNFYYFCEAEPGRVPQHLEPREQRDRLVLEFVDPRKALEVNLSSAREGKLHASVERPTRVLQLLIDEGYFS